MNLKPLLTGEMVHSNLLQKGVESHRIHRPRRQSRGFARRDKLAATINNGFGILMNAATARERTRISVNRYQKMVAAGILSDSDRIELINGDMVNMAPIGPKHASITARLTKQLVPQVGDSAIVSPGGR